MMKQDAFAQLRGVAPVGLLPAHALLPQVDISATQAGRDNALIAAEAEIAVDSALPSQPKPRAQYLNDMG